MKIYIEAGANDGIFQSRSLQYINNLEYFGILIEALPDMANLCSRNRENDRCRVFNAALVPFGYDKEFIEINLHKSFTAMATIKTLDRIEYPQTTKVKAMTLTSILQSLNINLVDIFYLDVEGYELEVLKGIDFKKITIEQIELELHYKLKGIKENKEEEINKHIEYMIPLGYKYNIFSEEGQHDKILFKLI
jgi:FkbM family methyltransferase